MNITLLGNGFDLYYSLPTKYENFLNTVHYLSCNDWSDLKTLGDVFRCQKLQEIDPWIAKSYHAYKEIYDTTPFNFDDANKLMALSKNMWFQYLRDSLNRDIGWIDFEKEIAFVASCFQERFSYGSSSRLCRDSKLSTEAEYIINKFDFFIDDKSNRPSYSSYGLQLTKDEYCIEYPIGSKNKILDKKKIVDVLTNSLNDLASGLKFYLSCFVDRILPELINQKMIASFDALHHSDYVITFNYSNTYERFNLSDQVFHIHGTLESNIVLGINPDSSDTFENADTTFIAFKKYYQRTMLGTDKAYIRWLRDHKDSKEFIHLVVMGHSLDISDKDIISELFKLANEIVVLCRDKEDESKYIANLVKIFGSEKFTSFRYEKNLTFVNLYSNHTSLVKTRKETCSLAQFKAPWIF